MDLSAIVEVAIGIIFVWITLSLATIQIQEWINSRLDKRARDLEASLHEMLANPNLKAQFFDHPVIRGLTAKKRRKPSETPSWYYRWPVVKGFTRERRKLPSYIPAQQFALTLFDMTLTAGTQSSVIQQGILGIRDTLHGNKKLTVYPALIDELNILADYAHSAATAEAKTAITPHNLETLKEQANNFLQNFYAKHPRLKLDKEVEAQITQGLKTAISEAEKFKTQLDVLLPKRSENASDPVSGAPGSSSDLVTAQQVESALSRVRDGVAALSLISPEVNQSLNALLSNVEAYVTDKETELAKARGNVEQWFDDSMDRISGAYKRFSQFQALIIGLVIALLINIDSVSLTLYLWRDPSVRAVLATKASQFSLPLSAGTNGQGKTNPYDAMQNFRDQFSGLNLPIGWTLKEKSDPLFNTAAPGSTDVSACTPFPKGNDYFGIPFYGYQMSKYIPFVQNKCLTPAQPDHSTNFWLKLVGIIITAIAARQGAPFWFDMLKNLVNLRGTGPNPAEGKPAG